MLNYQRVSPQNFTLLTHNFKSKCQYITEPKCILSYIVRSTLVQFSWGLVLAQLLYLANPQWIHNTFFLSCFSMFDLLGFDAMPKHAQTMGWCRKTNPDHAVHRKKSPPRETATPGIVLLDCLVRLAAWVFFASYLVHGRLMKSLWHF